MVRERERQREIETETDRESEREILERKRERDVERERDEGRLENNCDIVRWKNEIHNNTHNNVLLFDYSQS